jgi:hypothetical protein
LTLPNPVLRASLAIDLAQIGPDASDAVPVLVEQAWSDASMSVREAAQTARGKIRK